MKRDFEKLGSEKFDVLVIGGGITGACVAHDAALRGLSVALVEMKDFGWATSSATSKLIHGGLRYLKNLEFGLVRESLRERRIMEKIAPHLVYPLPFLIPTYKNSSNNRLTIYPGMIFYDLLSYDKGNLEDPARVVPHFELLSRRKVLELEPDTNPEELTGGAIYYDCQMYSSERLTFSFILSAEKNGAQVANYARVENLIVEEGRVKGAKVKDETTGQTHEVRASVTVNVTGPWADFVSGMALGESKHKVVRSEGIHIITRSMVSDHALVYRTESGRHFFIIPWRGKSLIGTTDTRYDGSPDEYGVSKENVRAFIDEINQAHPKACLTMDDVEYSYGGLRPIVEDETDVELDVYDKSRKYEIFDHAEEDNLKNFLTVIGGKYTTSRSLAEELVDRIFNKLGKEAVPCKTDETPLAGGNIRHWDQLVAAAFEEHKDIPEATVTNLVHNYGTRYTEVFELAESDPLLVEPIAASTDTLKAQIAYSAANEMTMTLEDILMRRMDIALLASMTKKEIGDASAVAGKILGWDDERILEEKIRISELFNKKNMKY